MAKYIFITSPLTHYHLKCDITIKFGGFLNYYILQPYLALMETLEERVYTLLKDKLPAHFVYHNLQHTQQVHAYAEHLALTENITGEELHLLKTAALFHDTGYTESITDHEEKSCDIARKILSGYNYTSQQVDAICDLIMATKVPQLPMSATAKILCDADLYYLGTQNYFKDAEKLYLEMRHYRQLTQDEWLQEQVNFFNNHTFFTDAANKELKEKKNYNLHILEADLTEENFERKQKSWRAIQDTILIVIGIITTGFGLKGFLVPNNLFDGGISGISLLLHEIYGFNLPIVIVLANLPLVILSGYLIDKWFAIKTMTCIVLLSVCIHFFPYPVITEDKLLVCIFGGFFIGVGIGLTMRAGSALDGIEVLALYTRRKTSFTVTEIVFGINVIIFLVAALEFDLQTSLYSMLTYFAASKTVDYVVEGIEAYTGVTIISGKSEIIKDRLVNELGRGITIYKGERGYLPGKFEIHNDTDIIFTVITRLELRRLKDVVYNTDPAAFVFASIIKEASGGVLKRRREH